jgi:hypothetical protein
MLVGGQRVEAGTHRARAAADVAAAVLPGRNADGEAITRSGFAAANAS